MRFLFSTFGFAALAAARARTSAPPGALTVGPSGTYSTIQDAVDALDTSSTKTQSIFIEPGTYEEQVVISVLDGPLIIYGYTEDTSSYAANVVTITASHALADTGSDDAAGTLRVETTNGFMLFNVNARNSYGHTASNGQALALAANKGNQGYYGCAFYGWQDTVLAQAGKQVYGKCYFEGVTDFIYGQHALAWFDRCDIRVLKAKIGYITASGRASDTDSYYVFNRATIAAAADNVVTSGSFYLGRPWRNYARVAFQFTTMTDVINGAGWHVWKKTDPRTDHVTLAEFNNTGVGSKGTRAPFSEMLPKAIAIEDILGIDYKDQTTFVDTTYLS
ncbi:carbohydrate esterase family 8 protein [Teratosphaeria destructans]|uniref:pectinesterase n=1 Tax=Teratosphaeria destructans TaxID=418781 RepID=A0A9W7VY57_9PEZI|nr:carbohydrate esterase family 8 protein [Teratosphaeria destructans]